MESIIDFFSKPWVGNILGLLGIGAAVYFYLRSRRVSRLAFQKDGITLVGGKQSAFPDEVSIHFEGDMVEQVTRSRFVIWNAGNTTLDGKHVAESDPLRLELKGGAQFLKLDVLRTSREVNKFTVAPRSGNSKILDAKFDYLDPGDGITIEILHSGSRSDLSLHGTIRGLPQGISDFGRVSWYQDRPDRRIFVPVLLFCGGGAMVVVGLMRPTLSEWFPKLTEVDPTKPEWGVFSAGVLYISLSILAMWVRRRRYPPTLEPNQKDEASDVASES